MSLTNSQYNAIIRSYEEKQRKARYLQEEHTQKIYAAIPEYEDLDRQVSSISIAQGRKLLGGDSNALTELKEQLKLLSQKKAILCHCPSLGLG